MSRTHPDTRTSEPSFRPCPRFSGKRLASTLLVSADGGGARAVSSARLIATGFERVAGSEVLTAHRLTPGFTHCAFIEVASTTNAAIKQRRIDLIHWRSSHCAHKRPVSAILPTESSH